MVVRPNARHCGPRRGNGRATPGTNLDSRRQPRNQGLRARPSSVKFSLITLTRGSPNKPKSRLLVHARTSLRTVSWLRPRALATRGTCNSAFATLMCGSRPLPDSVTASAGTGTFAGRPLSDRYATMFCMMFVYNVPDVGPRLLPLEDVGS